MVSFFNYDEYSLERSIFESLVIYGVNDRFIPQLVESGLVSYPTESHTLERYDPLLIPAIKGAKAPYKPYRMPPTCGNLVPNNDTGLGFSAFSS